MKHDSEMLRSAMFVRNYGASELMLAKITGRYPPPHEALDEMERVRINAQSNKQH